MTTRSALLTLGLVVLAGCTSSLDTSTPAAQAMGTSSGGVAASTDSSVTFRNRSNWAIFQIRMSPVSQSTWGPDRLGSHVIRAGESFTLHGVPCDRYDVKLIDEDGDECVVHNVGVCDEDAGWNIDNDELLSCQAFTRASGAH